MNRFNLTTAIVDFRSLASGAERLFADVLRFRANAARVDFLDWGLGVDTIFAEWGIYVVSVGPLHVTVLDTAVDPDVEVA